MNREISQEIKDCHYNDDDDFDVKVFNAMNEKYKADLIKELTAKDGIGINVMESINSTPIKIKKPFKVRKNEFIGSIKNKLLTVFG